MTLSDPFCVDRYRAEFLDLMRSGTVDIVFANEHEVMSLYQTASLDAAISAFREDCRLGLITRSEKGSIAVTREETITIKPVPVSNLVDTTGAGDLYAAGFLFGYTHNRSITDCGRLGSLAAALCIEQIGPRVQVSLKEAAEQAGLL